MAARRCVVRELVWLDPVANDGGNGRSRLDWSSDEINCRLEPSAVFEIEAAATGLVGSKCRELDFFFWMDFLMFLAADLCQDGGGMVAETWKWCQMCSDWLKFLVVE